MDNITVVVCTYNGTLNAILATIESIVKQRGIHVKLIVKDDGSSDNHKNDIERYLAKVSFDNYILLMNEENRGTVESIDIALNYVTTEYVKFIGQGDLLYDENTLSRVVDFMRKGNYGVAFGKMIAYTYDGNEISISEMFSPLDISSYLKLDYKKIKEEYFLYLNNPCGAIHLYKTDIAKKYIKEIVGHVKYCEDIILGLFLLDGGELGYFRDFMIWYEVGNGISTSNDNKIKSLFKIELINCFNHIAKIRNNTLTQKAARVHAINVIRNPYLRKIYRILRCPSIIWFRIRSRFNRNLLRNELEIENADKKFIKQCFINSIGRIKQ